ncbi:hypothetical protein VKT23_002607 [Stygiomarasmius scandens]|uniref:Heterokaryon incompatibility domain-containing protein n=1 Tax=Marasmiellus scandens TaxID=2682957 RepID=A0ABR1K6J5_9AGAR
MRLLNTTTLHLSEFPGCHVPPYAILSHTWGEEEISFQDIQSPHSNAMRGKAGYKKLQGCCSLARQEGFEFIWIDTCCINKDSSAELSEALNSMYRYYQDAEVCYAYLPDVNKHEDPRSIHSSFRNCRWFTRGWTLQELLAPSTVIFFDVDWKEVGTKSSLQDVITAITGIPAEVLLDDEPQNISIATRMSWAATRETTREEDRAYCLMGIFGVHMPTLYGEGETNAFRRLQLEIIKFSRDRSIFAWRAPVGTSEPRGLLAKSPFEFRTSGNVGVSDDSRGVFPYSMTNHGLFIQLPMEVVGISDKGEALYVAFLDCQMKSGGEQVGIYLKKVGDPSQNQFMRWSADEIELIMRGSSWRPEGREEAYIREDMTTRRKRRCDKWQFNIQPLKDFVGFAIQQQSYTVWQSTETVDWEQGAGENIDQKIALSVSECSDVTLLFRHKATGEQFTVIFGIHNFHIFSDISTDVGFGMSPLEHEFFKKSYTLGDRRDMLGRALDRVSKRLGEEKVVSLAIRKKVGPGEYDVDIDIVPGQYSMSKELIPPEYGFLIKTESANYSLKSVFPPDIVPVNCRDPEVFVSIDHRSDGLLASRMLVFESPWNRYPNIVIILGIHQSLRVWTDILIEPVTQSIEEMWMTYHKSDERRGKQLTRSKLLSEDDWLDRCSRTRSYQRSQLHAVVITGKRTTLQEGSHWAQIHLSCRRKTRKRRKIPPTPPYPPPLPPQLSSTFVPFLLAD